MRPFPLLAAVVALAACQAAPPPSPTASVGARPVLVAPEPPRPSPVARAGASRLELEVERMWSEDGEAFASVRVRNVATYELVKITVECSAIDPAGPTPRMARETVLAPSEAPLQPGDARTRRISFGRCGSVESMTCTARAL